MKLRPILKNNLGDSHYGKIVQESFTCKAFDDDILFIEIWDRV
jgi:hypothetical protein